MQEKTDLAVADLVARISVEQIPSVLVLLVGRLLTEGSSGHNGQGEDSDLRKEGEGLVAPGQLAKRLNLPESWIRNEERLGRIPSIRAGKYVRFSLSEVERALAERKRQGL